MIYFPANFTVLSLYQFQLFVLVKMEEYVHHQDSVLVDMVGLDTDVKLVSCLLHEDSRSWYKHMLHILHNSYSDLAHSATPTSAHTS